MLKRLFRNLSILSLVTVCLIGCGFQPLMTGQNESPQRYILKINGSGYTAYKFRRELEKQLAASNSKLSALHADGSLLKEEVEDQDIADVVLFGF